MLAAPTITLAAFLKELDAYEGRVPLALLTDRLRALDVKWDEIEPFVRFADDTYRRNLMHVGPGYHALVLCWRSGQRSPIHDHRGSSCGVRVLRGTAAETIFLRTPEGHAFPTRTRELHEGFCCGSQDADIHQISNLMAPGEDLVTLHVYSPPLLVMGQYSLTDPARTEINEPVFDFTAGAGI
jgi:cysteine dioxygenase